MRNKTVLLAILGIFAINISIIQAQEVDTTYWLKGGVTTLTFSQVNLTNWASGGNNNISMNGYFNVFANYTKAKVSWTNNLEMGYGVVKQGLDAAPQKTDDIIIATTQIGYKLRGEKLYWSSLLDFRTQFYQGIDAEGNVISDFMSPGYLLVATGLDWRPSPVLSVTYAPVTGKFTFVADQELANEGAFGVDEGKTSRAELGSFLKVKLQLDNVVKNVSIGSKLELFSNYLDNFGNVDVNWQNIVAMKVNSFLTVNWQTQLIYDDDIKIASGINLAGESIGSRPRTQFKSVFGVGLSFKFGDLK
ncbi:MAG: hypothetical protein ACI8QD_001095 [Cyclobacteriaceae bacterium]|jgi:hypothetical protein